MQRTRHQCAGIKIDRPDAIFVSLTGVFKTEYKAQQQNPMKKQDALPSLRYILPNAEDLEQAG